MDDVFDHVDNLGRPALVLSFHPVAVHEVVARRHYALVVCLDRVDIIVLRCLCATAGWDCENALIIEIDLVCEAVSVLLSAMVIDRHSDSLCLILYTHQRVWQISSRHLTETLPLRVPLGSHFSTLICKARYIDHLRFCLPVGLWGERVNENPVSIVVVFISEKVIHRFKVFFINVSEIIDTEAISGSQLVIDLGPANAEVNINHPVRHIGIGLFWMEETSRIFGFWRYHSFIRVEDCTAQSVPEFEVWLHQRKKKALVFERLEARIFWVIVWNIWLSAHTCCESNKGCQKQHESHDLFN